MTTRQTPDAVREAVARIVDPNSFKSRQSLYDYCISQGDTEDEARRIADDTHKPDCDKAFAKTDAILAALDSRAGDAGEGLKQQAHEWRRREVQAIGAAISTRSWHAVEQAYNSLRDKMDAAGCWHAPATPAPAVDAQEDRHPGWTDRGHAWLDAGAPAVDAVPAGEVELSNPRQYTVGPLTMDRVFRAAGLTNMADMQAVLDAMEAALSHGEGRK